MKVNEQGSQNIESPPISNLSRPSSYPSWPMSNASLVPVKGYLDSENVPSLVPALDLETLMRNLV